MDEVHVRQLTGIVHRSPGASDGVQLRRNHAGLDGLSERLFEKRREHVVLFATSLNIPFPTAAPVLICLRIGAHTLHELVLVDARQVKHRRRCHHMLTRRHMRGRARSLSHISIARSVNHNTAHDCLTSSF